MESSYPKESSTTPKIASEHAEYVNLAGQVEVIPDQYFRGRFYLGTYFAACLSALSGVGGFSFAAPILNIINQDIGPDANYVWISLAYTLTFTIGYTIVGRLSDLFGRRWFFIGGSILAVIGNIVAATANSIPTLIGGTVLIGLAASTQLSFIFLMGELTPVRHRFLVNGMIYAWIAVPVAFGPAISYGFTLYTSASWRWNYYFLLIINVVATLLYGLFYFPPTFEMKNRTQTKLQVVKGFDFVGLFLFVAGLLLFLMGLSWGGVVYPWKSAHVIATFIVGFLTCVAFGFWEAMANLEEPLMPTHLFRNWRWVVCVLLGGFTSSVYFAFSILWPQMVFSIYTTDLEYGSWLSCVLGGPYVVGIVASSFTRYLGHVKWQLVACTVIFTPLIASISVATVDNKRTVIALLVSGEIFVGWVECVALTLTSILIKDQKDIGVAVGIGGTFRLGISTVGTAIYLSVLSNRMSTTIARHVPPALIQAGLPATSVQGFIEAITAGSFSKVPGVTPAIIAAGVAAYKQAAILAFRTVWLTTIAFSGMCIICTLLLPPVDDLMTGEVVAKLHETFDPHDLEVKVPSEASDSEKRSPDEQHVTREHVEVDHQTLN